MTPLRAVILVVGFAMLAVMGCKDTSSGDYFRLDGRLVVFNYRMAEARFLVNIRQLRELGPGHIAVASFENPDGGPELEVEEKIWPNSTKTTFNSPPVSCIVKDKPYKVSIRIVDPSGKALQTLETTVVSDQDQEMLPDRPLVVGPLYTPNPDVSKPDPGDVKAAASRCKA